jgi:hypothetical protein
MQVDDVQGGDAYQDNAYQDTATQNQDYYDENDVGDEEVQGTQPGKGNFYQAGEHGRSCDKHMIFRSLVSILVNPHQKLMNNPQMRMTSMP